MSKARDSKAEFNKTLRRMLNTPPKENVPLSHAEGDVDSCDPAPKGKPKAKGRGKSKSND